MLYYNRIDQAYSNAKHMEISETSKIVLMSDIHRSDGSASDDFADNQNLFFTALNYYFDSGFTYIELGDGDELWENKNMRVILEEYSHIFWIFKKFYQMKRLHFIFGNHDVVKKERKWLENNFCEESGQCKKKRLPIFENLEVNESILLCEKNSDWKILLIHGHQADFFNDKLWRISCFLVRYFWRPMQLFGVKDPTQAGKNKKKKEKIEKALKNYSERKKIMLIAGHTHRAVLPKPGESKYFNDGSGVHPRCVTAIEIENFKISLVKWNVCVKKDGALFVSRETLEGPEKIESYLQ